MTLSCDKCWTFGYLTASAHLKLLYHVVIVTIFMAANLLVNLFLWLCEILSSLTYAYWGVKVSSYSVIHQSCTSWTIENTNVNLNEHSSHPMYKPCDCLLGVCLWTVSPDVITISALRRSSQLLTNVGGPWRVFESPGLHVMHRPRPVGHPVHSYTAFMTPEQWHVFLSIPPRPLMRRRKWRRKWRQRWDDVKLKWRKIMAV